MWLKYKIQLHWVNVDSNFKINFYYQLMNCEVGRENGSMLKGFLMCVNDSFDF